jgi:fibro-slime domain-containing protein
VTIQRCFFLSMVPLSAALACSAGGGDERQSVVTPEGQGGAGSAPVVDPGPAAPAPVPEAQLNEGPMFGDVELEPPDPCDSTLPVTYRDFSQLHPDFEMAFSGDEPRLHLVQPQLGVDGKPVFLDGVGCPRDNQRQRECNSGFHPTEAVITSQASFDQWYRTIDGTNFAFDREIELGETSPGSGVYQYSSNAFFPLEPNEGFGATPPGQGRNFLFTTEIHLLFSYQLGQVFSFRGDDDLWIFINGKLALDLGGMHGEREASIDFDAQAAELGIVPAGSYSMDVFHAERHTSASNFSMQTNIACFSPGILR